MGGVSNDFFRSGGGDEVNDSPVPRSNKQHSQNVLVAMLNLRALAKKWRLASYIFIRRPF